MPAMLAAVATSRLCETVPMEPGRPAVTLVVRKEATAAGDAAELAASASTAAQVTRGAVVAVACRHHHDDALVHGSVHGRGVAGIETAASPIFHTACHLTL